MEKEGAIPFDDLFNDVGSFGAYQVMLSLVMGIVAFTGVESMFLNFVGYVPEHWCKVKELVHLPYDTQQLVSLPVADNGDGGEVVYESCIVYNLNYSRFTDDDFLHWNRSVEITNGTTSIPCNHGWVYDQSLIVQSITTKWNLVCGDSWMVPFVGTMSILGFMLGSIMVGILSDRYGRYPAFVIFLLLKIGGSFLSAFAPNYPTIIVARILLSIGSIGNYVVAFTLVQETVGPAYRTVVGVGYAAIFSLGFMTVAGIGYFLRDDVTVQIVMAAMPCSLLPFIWFIPESPRWLLLNGRTDAADKVVRQIARVNQRELPDDFDVNRVIVCRNVQYNTSILDIVRSAELRKRGAILSLHWFTDSLIFYALSLNTAALSGDVYLNTFISAAVEIPANLLAVIFMNWKTIGRRWTAFLSLLTAGLASLICVPIIITEGSPTAVTVLSMVGKAGATMGFTCMYLYTSELFPTEVRSIGIGMCSFAARVSGMLAPYVGGPLGEVWLPLPSLIFGSFGILAGAFSFFLPETLGTNLPDTIEDVEKSLRTCEVDSVSHQSINKGRDNQAYDATRL